MTDSQLFFYFRLMRSVFVSFILFLLSNSYNAQQEVISFQYYGIAEGLSDNNIRCLHFDREGYLWIGTNEGLNRFDGEEFFTYLKAEGNKKGLCGNLINDIIDDKSDGLWIATRDGGICRLNKKTGEVYAPKLVSKYSPEGVRYVHALAFDNKERLIVATDKGIYRSNESYTEFNIIDTKHIVAAYDLSINENKIITSYTGRSICTIENDSVINLPLPDNFPYPAHTVRKFFTDSKQNIWLACWDNYLHCYDPFTHKIEHIDFMSNGSINYSGDEIISITEPHTNLIWLCMKSGELWQYDLESKKGKQLTISNRETARLNGNHIYCCITDAYQRTWIGTDAGLHVYNPLHAKFDIYWLEDAANTVTCFRNYEDGLLIGTTKGLLQLKNRELTNMSLGLKKEQAVHSIFFDRYRHMILGTDETILMCNNTKQPFYKPYKAKSYFDITAIPSSQVNAITNFHFQSHHLLLANAYGHGTIVLLPELDDWILGYVIADGEMDNLIKGFFTDNAQRLWFFGSLTGISCFERLELGGQSEVTIPWDIDPKFALLHSKAYSDNAFSKDITGMIEQSNNKYWLATQGSGLLEFDISKDSNWYTSVSGSPLTILALVKDNRGKLWMSAKGALYSFAPEIGKWHRYDEKDGIPATGLSRALYADSSGIIYAGGNGFFITLNPEIEKTNNELPRTKITHIKVMDIYEDSVLHTGHAVWSYEQNFITFYFTALCFNNASNCTFDYMLEGLDETWRSNASANYVAYSKLPFGEYTFKVRAYNSDGVMDKGIASFSFKIRAPFYLRWWFISFLLIAVSGLLWAALRYRYLQKIKLEAVRNKIARDLHDDIGSALGSINYFSETAKRTLRSNNESSTRHVLEKIGSTSREMIENMHDIVWAVNPDNDTFSHVIERMKSFATDLASVNELKLLFEFDPAICDLKLSMTERKNLYLIYKETLYNSCKYSGGDTLTVKFSKPHGSNVILLLADNGKGFDVAKRIGKGNGLINIHKRAEEIKARLSIVSDESGTRTLIEL